VQAVIEKAEKAKEAGQSADQPSAESTPETNQPKEA
jgi:hypothetical protein